MQTVIEDNRASIADLCRTFAVRRLDLFGSAVNGDSFDPATSDLDFLVEFDSSAEMGPAGQYFGLLASLEILFGLKVDLVTARSLKNPYFIRSINKTRQVLYASEMHFTPAAPKIPVATVGDDESPVQRRFS